MFKKSLVIFTSVVIVSLIIYLVINRNNPTIIDLGNGWKSYSHPQIGFTVKIPSDAEVVYEVGGEKRDYPGASFSKGQISHISTWTAMKYDGNNEEQNQHYLDFINYTDEKEREWRTYELNRGRSFLREFTIDNKQVLVRFEEEEIVDKENDVLLMFTATNILIAGKTRLHRITLNPNDFITQIIVTPDHPHYTQEEIEEFIKKDVEKIKDLIISIDNF